MTKYIIISIIVVAAVLILALLFKNFNRIKYTISSLGELSEHKKDKLRVQLTTKYEDIDAVKFECDYVNDKKDGEEKLYYPTGELNRIQHWKSGKLHGEMIVFYRNGNPYIKGHYFNGNLTGDYTIYKPNGMILKTIKH